MDLCGCLDAREAWATTVSGCGRFASIFGERTRDLGHVTVLRNEVEGVRDHFSSRTSQRNRGALIQRSATVLSHPSSHESYSKGTETVCARIRDRIIQRKTNVCTTLSIGAPYDRSVGRLQRPMRPNARPYSAHHFTSTTPRAHKARNLRLTLPALS